ncbi:hypothetical protein TNCV_2628151 [Trichonephila clavipes]|nr:hypothetical protein TNCV_2628151 [Trichonephila clavipes]
MPTPPAEPEIPSEPKNMPPAEPERPPMEMVDPSVSVNTVEVTPLLILRCDKGIQTISPTLMSNALILERGSWNNHRQIKDSLSNRNPRRFKKHCFVDA